MCGETLEQATRAILEFERNPEWVERILEDAEHVPGGTREPSVRNALLTAFLDAQGTRRRIPLHKLLNLPEGRIASSVTISVGTPDEVLKEAFEWHKAGWQVFKVKLGSKHDEAALKALRDHYPDKSICVDANEAWSLAEARTRLKLLERLNVDFVEQPLPRDRLEESAALASEFEIPVIVDESVLDSDDLMRVVREGAADGINIKLNKCGGPYEARRMVKIAKDHDLKVMMGCMLESSLGIAAGAAFAGVLDYADLDGNVLVTNDPFQGFAVAKGIVETPRAGGVGVVARKASPGVVPLGSARGAKQTIV
ncbi:MAG: dipeptide epimerase [Euryarchaeota archaeon]|nr:dipeptide epimerase [Euryarchaeota archaeon]